MHHIFFRLFILYTLIGVGVAVQAQSGFDASKLTYGGGLGFSVGSGGDEWGLGLSPQIGYNFTDKINAGAGFSYSYFKDTEKSIFDSNDKWKHTKHYLGFNLFGNYYPINWIVLTVKPEIMRMWETQKMTGGSVSETQTYEKFIPAFVIGAGVRLRPVTFTLNYDVAQSDDSPYGDNVFFNVGFMF